MTETSNFSELNCSAPDAAQRLLGCELERTLPDGQVLRARIVETEAYDESDPGSHTYRGRSERNAVMYGPAGFMYVYFIYGMHYCCNIATGPDGHGEAVLIRAVEPVKGEPEMTVRRKGQTAANLTNGPSKLCMALDITKEFNGHDLSRIPLRLVMHPALSDGAIVQTTRIGLTKGTATPWRFYIRGNPYVSKV
jgi:DNA-3-methyladenine glycosylase